MCIACKEYMEGKLSLYEMKNALLELILTDTKDVEHYTEIYRAVLDDIEND
jgi:hypothetical protein